MLDLLVLGGGVSGLGVARLAARSGWSVALIERDDLVAGASSASSHLLHGGLRYLEHGRLGLVREALHERRAVLALAPGYARERRFLAPVLAGGRVPAWKLRVGLGLYDALAGSARLTRHGWLGREAVRAAEPALAPALVRGAGVYSDVVMDDAALAIAVARDAAAHGARLHPHTRLVAVAPDGAGAVVASCAGPEGAFTLAARSVVNATGAWSDATRALLAPIAGGATPPRLAPSRGTHLVYPALTRGHGLVLTAALDGRAFFVVPFAGRSLVGTTEVAVPSPPPDNAAVPTADEIAYLHAEVSRIVPGAAGLRPLAVFAGLRPLLAGGSGPGAASREHEVRIEGTVATLAGGKWTTFRVMARDTLRALAGPLGREAPRDTFADPLPAPLDAQGPEALGERASRDGFARTLAGTMRRRSSLWLADDGGVAAAPAVAEGMARVLGWSESRRREEVAAWAADVREQRERIERALGGRNR